MSLVRGLVRGVLRAENEAGSGVALWVGEECYAVEMDTRDREVVRAVLCKGAT
jgi:hypothetical protein